MMRRALEIAIACLLAAGPLYAQQIGIPVKRGVITVDSAPSGDCSAVPGQVRQIRGTRETYVCEGGSWVRKDLPVCSPDPPSGSCSDYSVCMSTTGAIYVCASGSWSAIANTGDMSKSTYDTDSDGTVEAADVALNADMKKSVYDADDDGSVDMCEAVKSDDCVGDFDLDGTNENAATHTSRVIEAWAHASLYGDPVYYLAPSVYDQWIDIFKGKPLASTYNGDENVELQITRCYTASCNSASEYICVNTVDPDGDGTDEVSVNDVIYIGDATSGVPKGGTYAVRTVEGDGVSAFGSCAAGEYRIRIMPLIDEDDPRGGLDQDNDGTLDSGLQVVNVWVNANHPTNSGRKLIGYRLGYAPRLRDGSHGVNLLRNGEAEYDATVKNWERAAGDVYGGSSWVATPSNTLFQCWQGDGSNDCLYFSGTGTNAGYTADWITVSPGERYVLSGYYMRNGTGDYVTLATDVDNDGTLETSTLTQYKFDGYQYPWFTNYPNWFWTWWEIPSDVDRVKVYVSKTVANASKPLFDAFELRRVTTWAVDDFVDQGGYDCGRASSVFLINDPGNRTIVVTGDSWTTSASPYIEQGLETALQERFGRDFSSQVISTGVGGYTAQDIIDNFDTMIAQYEPLYVVISVGTNDANSSTITEDTFIENVQKLAHMCRMIGAIPIFLSVPPCGGDSGAGSVFEKAHGMWQRERQVLLHMVP